MRKIVKLTKSSDSSDTGLYKLLTGAMKMTDSFKSTMLLHTRIKQKERYKNGEGYGERHDNKERRDDV